MARNRWALAPAAVVLSIAACEANSTPPPAASTSSAIISGTADTGDPAVVAIVQRRVSCAPAPINIFCTGTLVSPRHVLAAAHCTKASTHPGAFEIYFGSRSGVDPNERYVRVSSIVVHPLWDDAKREHDAALFELAEAVSITPAVLPTSPMDSSMVGSPLRAVGFGLATLSQGVPDGAKREGAMKLDAVNPFNFRATPGPALTCAGDSGGPVFMTIGGIETLVGITVSGDPPCSVFATNTRVDTVTDDFIKPTLAADAGAPPSPTVAPDRVCSQACASDDDCPEHIACGVVPGDSKNRCQLPAILAGDFGAACTTDSDCHGTGPCARLGQSGPDACRCFRSCSGAIGFPGADAASDAAPSDGGPAASGSSCSIRATRPTRAGGASLLSAALAMAAIAVARRISARTGSGAPSSRSAPRSR